MQIQITIRWSRKRSAARSFTVRRAFKLIRCLATGHDEELFLRDRALAVRCKACGWTSPGWTIDEAAPTRR
jgi:hypothetical protein